MKIQKYSQNLRKMKNNNVYIIDTRFPLDADFVTTGTDETGGDAVGDLQVATHCVVKSSNISLGSSRPSAARCVSTRALYVRSISSIRFKIWKETKQ